MLRLLVWLLAILTPPATLHAVDEVPDPIPPVKLDCTAVERTEQWLRQRFGDGVFDRHIQLIALHVTDNRGVEILTAVRVDPPEAVPPPEVQPFQYDARPEVYLATIWEWRVGGATPYRFHLDFDPDGNLLGDPIDLAIPDCAEDPEAYRRMISAGEAKEIATNVNDPGGSAYIECFAWHVDHKRLVYSVRAYPSRRDSQREQRLLVDAFSGQVLAARAWSFEPDRALQCPRNHSELPDSIPPLDLDCGALDGARELIRSRLGQDVYDRQIQFDGLAIIDSRGGRLDRPPLSGTYPPVWFRTYWEWRIPRTPPIPITLETDQKGQPVGSTTTMRLPDCVTYPELCDPRVSRQQASEIAETVRMPEMTTLENASLLLKAGRLAWSLKFATGIVTEPVVHSQYVVVDAVSGEVLESSYEP